MKVYHFVISIVLIILLVGCQSVSKEERMYESAQQFINTKSYPQAIGVLSDLGDYKKSKQYLAELRYIINGSYIGVGNDLIAAIKSDGTVIHRGGYEHSLSTEDWNHIKALSTNGEYIEGLVEDGKLVSTYPYTVRDLEAITTPSAWAMMTNVEQLPKLEGVASFQSNYPRYMLALLENGIVHVMNPNLSEEDIAAIKTWEDIVEVATNGVLVVGLKADGSVLAIGERYERYEVNEWNDIVAISMANHIIGLKKDGTVVAAGDNNFGENDVKDWSDMIAISAANYCTVGLKQDGTVIATGDNTAGQCHVDNWEDVVAIDTSEYYTMGLKSDGTLLLVGNNYWPGANVLDVSNISNILVPTIHVE